MVQNPTIHAEGLHLPEAECLRCGCLVPDGQRLCPAYGTALATLDDVVERASERTLDERGRVETVHGRAATWLAEGGGRIGRPAAVSGRLNSSPGGRHHGTQ